MTKDEVLTLTWSAIREAVKPEALVEQKPEAPEGFRVVERRPWDANEWILSNDRVPRPMRNPVAAGRWFSAWILVPKHDAPEGFEHTLERRRAKPKEWVQSDKDGSAYQIPYGTGHDVWILIPTEAAPPGRELLEYRLPKKGEEFMVGGGICVADKDYDRVKYWIVKPLKDKPEVPSRFTDADIDRLIMIGIKATNAVDHGDYVSHERVRVRAILREAGVAK